MQANLRTYYERKPRGHVWKIKDGIIDVLAYNPGGGHNGPKCSVCGYGFCYYCNEGPDYDCPGNKETL